MTPTDNIKSYFTYSMKGYELYSWKIDNDWYFVLLPGTNHLKGYEEIISQKTVVKGLSSVKDLLRRLPKGTTVSWIDKRFFEQNKIRQKEYTNFVLPSKNIIKDIKAYCDNLGINLTY